MKEHLNSILRAKLFLRFFGDKEDKIEAERLNCAEIV
jgi:hypothetical protein